MASLQGLTGDKYAFLRMKAPASYVAGLGRGASGFTTRSDIGPAREGPSHAAGGEGEGERGTGADEGGEGDEDEAVPSQFQDPENETGLFAGTTYDADDEEADLIYDAVDAKMDERRRARREKREREQLEKTREERPSIQSQFADLKRGLGDVTQDQWASLPDVANISRKRAKTQGKTYAVPDSVLIGARDRNAVESSISATDEHDAESSVMNAKTDFAEIGQANQKMLSVKLAQMTDSASGSSTIDPRGYLTGLDSQIIKTDAEIGDIKRARGLLQSLTRTNPKHAPGWIAAAWLENVAGKQVAARKLIAEGCEQCPKSEDVWIAASELNTNENAKVILANAVRELPDSVRVWLRAVELEREPAKKKRVLRKALEMIPASVRLWKEAVKMEDNADDARVLLARAVEVIPTSAELWLALARLETPERAKGVLNKARKTIPTSHEIWIAAGRLQEQEGQLDAVDMVLASAVASLKKNGAQLSRDQWLHEAERCEAQGSVVTAQAILKATLHLDVDDEDREDTWLDDADSFEKKGLVECARAIYAYALKVYPQKQGIWRRAAELEKQHGTPQSLVALLAKAVESVPHAEVLWLMSAKQSWQNGDVAEARATLGRAFDANPDSESIWLAAVKLEVENGEIDAARQLMEQARSISGTERIWVKSVVFERQQRDATSTSTTLERALKLAKEGLAKYPTSAKLHMLHGQLYTALGNIPAAREAYAIGLKRCPASPPLWVLSSRLEEKAGVRIRARAILERARLANPKSEEIWLESVKVEERDGSNSARALMSRALQALPSSGALHAHHIWTEPRATRKSRAVDALKKTSNAVEIIVLVARLFWAERKIEKAREWFMKAVAADSDFGDAWAWFAKFEREHGTPEHLATLTEKVVQAEPHHGPVWQQVAKDPMNARADTARLLTLTSEALETLS